jgi:hypothetical protein
MTSTRTPPISERITDPYLRRAELHLSEMRQQAASARLARQARAAEGPTLPAGLATLLAVVGRRLTVAGKDARVEPGVSVGDARR